MPNFGKNGRPGRYSFAQTLVPRRIILFVATILCSLNFLKWACLHKEGRIAAANFY